MNYHSTITASRPYVTPHVGVLIPFIILSDSDDDVTTLPVRHAPPLPNYVLDSPDYMSDLDLDSDSSEDDSPGNELTETVELLSTQTASTSIVHLPTSLLPSSSSPPPSHLPSSSSPPPSLLPSSSHKRPRSPSPPPSPSVSPPPPSAVLPPPLEEGEPRYKIGESSSDQIHPIISEPIHHTIPLLVARLVLYDCQIEGIRDHMRDILVARSDSDERIETLEQEVKTLRSRAEYSEARFQQCEADILELRAHIKRLEDHSGM
ncbi:hypothetical protein Tco_1066046 [Tanacetum coccineum]